MCGIAGIVRTDGRLPEEGVLRGMAERVAHRGPDGDGLWMAPGIGLAHRRLSIIDLSPRAAQPMISQRFTIVFNGEIYNYRELREQLSGPWQSESDTEVIMNGYAEWGTDIFRKLRGMFAVAIWDRDEHRLILARDPVGKKPLYWSLSPKGDFYFASEMKALKGCVPFEIDEGAVRSFLGLQYVPTPKTGYLHIKQLRPGHVATFDVSGWKESAFHDWQKAFSADRPARSEQEIDADILLKIDDAVTCRLDASDVPVGAFLSSGIDSAAIVAFATRHTSRPIRTFTMGFPDMGMNERDDARKIAGFFKTDHMEFEARPEHLEELVDVLTAHYDAPFADSSALPTWLLARETAQEIKVILTGDGGDEAFGGYRRYGYFLRALQLRDLPVAHATQWLGAAIGDARFPRMAETLRALRKNPSRGYAELFCGSYFGSERTARLLSADFKERTESDDAVGFIEKEIERLGEGSDRHPLESAMLFDLTSYLSDDLNVKMDRATMAFGLEARCPFLDSKLIDFSLRLPLNQKVVHGKTKVALRRALRGTLPPDVLSRKKMGFQVPLAQWFRGPLRGMVRDRCLAGSSPLLRIMNRGEIERLLQENDKGTDHGNRLWMMLTLSTWLKNQNV